MPSTVVHVAFGLLVAAAVLGPYFDRRALLVVATAVAVVDLDTVTSLVLESTHRALFHTLLIPLFAAAFLYAEGRAGERSLVRERYGNRGVRVAWAAIAAVVISAIGLDLMNPSGVNLFYPLHDQFYALDGAANYSTQAGFQQSFVEFQTVTPEPNTIPESEPNVQVDIGARGSTREYHVASGVNPNKGREPRDVRRSFPIVFHGWQLFLVVASIVGLTARARLSPGVTMDDGAPDGAERDEGRRPAVRQVDGADEEDDTAGNRGDEPSTVDGNDEPSTESRSGGDEP
ncbi:MAG: metal-dependent hydrolase [Haloglomus sp.]